MESNQLSKWIISIFYILVVLFFCMSPSSTAYTTEYYCLLLGMALFGIVYAFTNSLIDENILQPIHILAFFYLFIFFITPMFLIITGDTDCHGTNVMGGCIPATLIAIIAFVFFCYGYVRRTSDSREVNEYSVLSDVVDDEETNEKVLNLSYILFLVFGLANIMLLLSIGYNMVFLFTFGGEGIANVIGIPDNLRFLFNCSYVLIVPWLFIVALSEKLWIKLLTSYILLIIFFAYGWRFIVIIMTISGLIVYTRKNNKQLNVIHVVILGGLLLLYSTIGGMVRGAMKSGQSTRIEEVTSNDYIYTLKSNFDIYQTFYGVVDCYPSKYDFYYGEATIFSPIMMWIPRYLWKDKPMAYEYPSYQAVINGCGEESVMLAAMSFPNILEYYVDFGILGVIFFSFLLGKLSRFMCSYYTRTSLFHIILYAIFCGFLVQLVNRGYMSMLVTLSVFLYSPILLYKKYYINRED